MELAFLYSILLSGIVKWLNNFSELQEEFSWLSSNCITGLLPGMWFCIVAATNFVWISQWQHSSHLGDLALKYELLSMYRNIKKLFIGLQKKQIWLEGPNLYCYLGKFVLRVSISPKSQCKRLLGLSFYVDSSLWHLYWKTYWKEESKHKSQGTGDGNFSFSFWKQNLFKEMVLFNFNLSNHSFQTGMPLMLS